MKMTVGKLREFLNEILDKLEDFNEQTELTLQSNTFFTREHNYVLQTPQGFLGLDFFDDEEDEEEDAE